MDPRRSAHMRKIKGKDSAAERRVRSAAHSLGYRFRLHRRDLPGTPDMVFPGLRKAIFVHGCFWHRHPGCSRTTTPKTRTEYWHEKFDQNVERDRRVIKQLEAEGWEVTVVWECETLDRQDLERRLRRFLG